MNKHKHIYTVVFATSMPHLTLLTELIKVEEKAAPELLNTGIGEYCSPTLNNSRRNKKGKILKN